MNLAIRRQFLLLFITLAFSRCVDLKEVGSFGTTSQQIMDKNKTVRYGYYDYYSDSAYIYHSMPDNLRDVDCHDCLLTMARYR